jgi:phosphoribosylaminoimidazole-succinocarboxamide synthase
MSAALFESQIKSLPLLHRGKVRDLYAVDDQHMLIVSTDRLSAFDVILPTPIPGKGAILTTLSNYWCAKLAGIVPHHLSELKLADVLPDAAERAPLEGRAVVVKRLKALPVEAIVRGYLIGSGWKDYQNTGAICGIALPTGLALAAQLPQPIFTPSTKAAVGEHDENVSFETIAAQIGADLAAELRGASLALYRAAAEHAHARGIIIADTKFEFGLDVAGRLTLMDEVLTPDSSRFWPADQYRAGISPPSFDKQYVRDWLETLTWDKRAPGPALPAEVVERTAAKYEEARRRLMG